jgi:ribosome-associated translation inhibitor RaiA
MQIPLQITFRGMSPMPSIGTLIQDRWSRLERFSDRMIRGHVTVAIPHRHHRNGRRYSVHLEIMTPLGGILVTREPAASGASEELDVAIREAFDVATRQLEEEFRRRRSA